MKVLKSEGGTCSDPRSFEGVGFAWLYCDQNLSVWGTPPAPSPLLTSRRPLNGVESHGIKKGLSLLRGGYSRAFH